MSAIPLPHPSRCDPSRRDFGAIIRLHEEAVVSGEATYRDPTTGYQVLTVMTLLERGECCGRGCRHCPFLDG